MSSSRETPCIIQYIVFSYGLYRKIKIKNTYRIPVYEKKIQKKACCTNKMSLTYLRKAYEARKITQLNDATVYSYILSPPCCESGPRLSSPYDARQPI
jgi:hypothetical protein